MSISLLRLAVAAAVASASLAGVPAFAAQDNWPQWRGPGSNGVATDGDYPDKFSSTESVVWKVKLPGVGMSTPAVWDDRILLTGPIGGNDGVMAFDLAGKELWRRSFGPERPGKNPAGSGSNPSPVTDGKHVVAYYKSGTLACLDLAGNVLWEKQLEKEFVPVSLFWDLGTSPVLRGDKVIVAVMHSGESFLVAFEVATGQVAWKTPRQYQRPRESDQSYTTPQIVKIGGRDAVVTFGADHLTAHDVATGKLLWDMDGFNPRDQGGWRAIASPAIEDGIALLCFGRGRYLAGVRIDGERPAELWRRGEQERGIGADSPTPAVHAGAGYVLSDSGRLERLDLATGKTTWSGTLPRGRGRFYASPVLAGGKIYCAREDGTIYVARDGAGTAGEPPTTGPTTADAPPTFDLLAENSMGEKVIATPVPIRGGLLVRGVEHLFLIAGRRTGN